MKYDSSLNLKWLEPHHPSLKDADFTLVNLCVLCQEGHDNRVTGVTIFQPRDFNESFISRLAGRVDRNTHQGPFTLYMPKFLIHRAGTLLASLKSVKVVYTSFLKLKEVNGQFHVRSHIRVVSVDDSP